MRFTNDTSTWSEWQTFAPLVELTLALPDGSKNIYVQFKDDAGHISSINDTIILDTTPPNANAGADQTVTVGNSVTLNGGLSEDNLGIASYYWIFGDGNNANGVSVSHTYAKAGSYQATLTVQDYAGNTASDVVYVLVQNQAAASPTDAN